MLPPDLTSLIEQLDAAEANARGLVDGLTEETACCPPEPGRWSVAECLDHLATANRVYLPPMQASAEAARGRGRVRRGAAKPGVIGRLFVAMLEPPPKWWSTLPAPRKIRPRVAPPLAETMIAFLQTHASVREFVEANADLDLSSIRFPNPFLPGVAFSLATGLHVIVSHERRHLWQAWGARRALEAARGISTPHRG